ncbi:hypothetical protein F511_06459 [Dorcoceras hygrometricum]|uniref:Uncharacterized protein n=1 Tax=Dorcoceras hygrometricum TaxID=472368 RepID=A0A2Z7D792_9LAMI|nr:hypothetical protein F511_06459 [Dorcoceras hygrometricum]
MVDSSTVAATGFFDDWILCGWLQLFATSAFLASGFPATGYAKHCSSLLIVDVTADFIIADPALALLFTTTDCDDINADVIIADFRYCASCQLLILDFFQSAMLTSSLLLSFYQ